MGKFLRGLLIGIGIAMLIAPKRGQEQRRLLSKRIQQIRGYLFERVQSNPTLQQAAERVTQTVTQAKETAQNTAARATTQVKETAQNATQQAAQVKNTTQDTLNQASMQAKETTKNAASTLQSTGLNTPLSEIPGMEPEPQAQLEALGIHTTGQLLEQTATKETRTNLAQRIGISAHMLRTLVDRADLMRLPSVGREMATLLEEAGVNGCKDLQHRNPEHLYATLIGTQESNKSAYLTPNLDELTQWIAEAKAETHSVRS